MKEIGKVRASFGIQIETNYKDERRRKCLDKLIYWTG